MFAEFLTLESILQIPEWQAGVAGCATNHTLTRLTYKWQFLLPQNA